MRLEFTPETRVLFLKGKLLLEGLRSPAARRYLDPDRNRRSFTTALGQLKGDVFDDVAGFLPQLNQALGELNDLVSGERPFFHHMHHMPDDLLDSVIRGRATLAKVLQKHRRNR